MKLWFLIIIAVIFQETVAMTTAFYNATQQGINIWIIHGLFIVATCFDIWFGYRLGGFISKGFLEHTQFGKWLKKHSVFLNKPGREYLLVLTGIIDFPYLNGLLGSWFELPFKLVFWTTLIGDLISYAIFWGLTIGVISVSNNGYLTTFIIIGTAIIIGFILERIFEKSVID